MSGSLSFLFFLGSLGCFGAFGSFGFFFRSADAFFWAKLRRYDVFVYWSALLMRSINSPMALRSSSDVVDR